jgi:hypothetical protein
MLVEYVISARNHLEEGETKRCLANYCVLNILPVTPYFSKILRRTAIPALLFSRFCKQRGEGYLVLIGELVPKRVSIGTHPQQKN